jgi:3-oxoadipate enol-lactonase
LLAVDPAAAYIQIARDSLITAGLERREFEGVVYWTNGGQATSPVLVLLHGVNDQAGTWAAVMPALARKYRVIVLDLPGHGESEPRSGPLPMTMILDRVARIVDREDARCFILVGNSFGGWLAILYALAHPDRVQHLVLESGGGLARPPAVPLFATDRGTAAMILRAVQGPDFVAPDWAIDALISRATDSPLLRLTGLLDWFVEPRLAGVHVPTTLVWGENDGVVPLSYAEALQDGIRNAKLKIIKGAAHIPHAQQPERFLECLTEISSPNGHD